MPKLSVTIITKNEAANIGAALESVAWADELVVVDSGSTDDTVGIARRYTDRVSSREWEGYGTQKNHAAGLAEHDWILSLDADERVSPELATEIRERLARETHTRDIASPGSLPTSAAGSDRRTGILTISCACTIDGRQVERQIRSRIGEHRRDGWAAPGTSSTTMPTGISRIHLATIDRYTTLAAHQMHAQGRRAGWLDVGVHPLLAFCRNYALRLGFRQGLPGLIVSLMNSYYVFLKFAKLWELQRREPPR